jgi:hypothetical protein
MHFFYFAQKVQLVLAKFRWNCASNFCYFNLLILKNPYFTPLNLYTNRRKLKQTLWN